jgi:uncharacterized protein (DUF433 family)
MSFDNESHMGQFDCITQRPDVMGGKACIRGMRVTVGMIVGQIGAGHNVEQILADYHETKRSRHGPHKAAASPGVGLRERLANRLSNIQSKADCPSDISHLCRGQGRDQDPNSCLWNGLQVVTVDYAILGYAVGFGEKDLGRYVSDCGCNGGDSYFT